MKAEQRAEGRYDSADSGSVSRVGMAGVVDHIRLTSELYALVSRLETERTSVNAHAMPSVKLRLAVEENRGAAERGVVRGSAESGSPSFSVSPGSRKEEEMGRRRSVGGRRDVP